MSFKRFYVVYLLWGALGALVVIYLSWQLLSVALPPKIILTQPETNEIKTQNTEYLIRGCVRRTYFLRINGELLPFDQGGNFEKSLKLQNALNFFNIEAESRFGKKTNLELKILQMN